MLSTFRFPFKYNFIVVLDHARDLSAVDRVNLSLLHSRQCFDK